MFARHVPRPFFGRWVALQLLTMLAIQQAHGQGEPTHAVLHYTRGPELEGCPSEGALKRSVAAHLGYDPFQDAQGVIVDARIVRAAIGLTATVEAHAEDGVALGRRELRSERGDCLELSRALALAVSVAIDPFVLSRPQSESQEQPAQEEPKAEPSRANLESNDVLPVESSPSRVENGRAPQTLPRPYLTVDGAVGWGFVPSVQGAIAAALWWPLLMHLRLQGELRYDLPATARASVGGEARASLASARLHVCASLRIIGVCVGTSQGALFANGAGVDTTLSERAWLPAASLLAYVHLLRRERWLLQLRAGADVPIRRVALQINGESAWTTPRFAPYAGLGLGWSLP